MADNEEVTVIVVKDLEAKFGLDGRVIRAIARKLGLKPEPTGEEGFGPRARYEWAEDSEKLAKLEEAIELKVKQLEEDEAQEEEAEEE